MSRKKKLAVNLGLIVLLGYLLLNINDLYFSQKDLLRVHERANHYGPSEEILVCHENPEGLGLVAGRLEDGNFSAFTTERAFGIFIRSTGGGMLPLDVHKAAMHIDCQPESCDKRSVFPI